MKDIKVLEEFIKEFDTDNNIRRYVSYYTIKSIKNLIARFKKNLKVLYKYEDELAQLDEKIEFYENKVFDELDNYINLDEFKKLDLIKIKGKEYISKDKIKEKIEKYKRKCKTCNFKGNICLDLSKNYNCVISEVIRVLQELLESEEK